MNKKINLAILIPSLGCGGAERSASLIANYLNNSNKFHVSFFVLDECIPFYPLSSAIKIYYIDKFLGRGNRFLRFSKRVSYIKNLAKKKNIDVLIGFSYLSSMIVCCACLLTKIKCIVCERSDPSHYSFPLRFIKNIIYKSSDGAIFQTQYVQDYFKGIVNNSVVIPNMIDSSILPDIIPFSKRNRKIVSVGRLDILKNHKMLIDAVGKIKEYISDYIVEIYGEGELREELQNQIDKLGLTNIVVLKGKSNDVLSCIKDAKLFVFTSNVEGFPNALLESAAMGLLCISTNCPTYAQKEMLKDSFYSAIVEMNNYNQLAEKLLTAINVNISDVSVITSSEKVRRKYNVDYIGRRWVEYIEFITCEEKEYGN